MKTIKSSFSSLRIHSAHSSAISTLTISKAGTSILIKIGAITSNSPILIKISVIIVIVIIIFVSIIKPSSVKMITPSFSSFHFGNIIQRHFQLLC